MSVGFTTKSTTSGAKWSPGAAGDFPFGLAVVFGVAIGFTSNNSWYLLAGLVAIPLMFSSSGIALGSFALALPFEAMFVAVKE